MIDESTQKNVQQWLSGNYDEKTKAHIRYTLSHNPKEIIDAFYTTLSFGTGGLRGIMGVGTNRLNAYTVRAASQGLSNYLYKQHKQRNLKFIIGYDSRLQSRELAIETAKVLAGNGIHVYLFKELRPTPLVSFGCRFYNCAGGIMITASHNPPEYNGYKVYWNDGGQVVPPHDQGIIEEVKKITDIAMVHSVDFPHEKIEIVDDEVDQAYLEAISQLQHYPEQNKNEGHKLKVVYSNLHGTGITMVPQLLSQWGFSQLVHVESQKEPNGLFPTVASPNPEEKKALALGIERLLEVNGDILLATDPDADRMGVAVNHNGKVVLLDGNQIACICLEHICHSFQNCVPKRAAFIKTIVTTELFKAIAEAYQRPCIDVLTGFKFIAQQIDQWEHDPEGLEFIFGGEESYGYLRGTFTRDKDAVSSCALLCEVALQAKLANKSLVDLLYDLYRKYGVYREKLLSINFEAGKAGFESMSQKMADLRQCPPKVLGGVKVSMIEDYSISIRTYTESNHKEKLDFPCSNVLLFRLVDGSKVVVRPSGTEPKIKLYCGVMRPLTGNIDEAIRLCDAHAQNLLKDSFKF